VTEDCITMIGEPERQGDRVLRLKAAAEITKFINKPNNFDGNNPAKFPDWKAEMETYMGALNLGDGATEIAIAGGFLRGTALKWWTNKLAQLKAAGQNSPTSWLQMLALLSERYSHHNPELAARQKLRGLTQNNMSVHQYMRTFDACYSHIPVYLEEDKVFNFISGLNPPMRAKFAVDPATKKQWTSYGAKLCMCCYQPNHEVATCTEHPARGAPPGFRPE